MDDIKVLFLTGWIGVALGILASVLYLLTSSREPGGFRVIPANADGWVGYWFRCLALVLSAYILLGCGKALT